MVLDLHAAPGLTTVGDDVHRAGHQDAQGAAQGLLLEDP